MGHRVPLIVRRLVHVHSPEEDSGGGNEPKTERDSPHGSKVVRAAAENPVRYPHVDTGLQKTLHPIKDQGRERGNDESEVDHTIYVASLDQVTADNMHPSH